MNAIPVWEPSFCSQGALGGSHFEDLETLEFPPFRVYK